MKALRLHTNRLGEVAEVVRFLRSLERAYDNLYAFDLVVDEAMARYGDRESDLIMSSPRRRSIRRITDAAVVVLPENRLILKAVAIESPGFWDFVGALNPLEVARKYLSDRHERRKDVDYRNKLEAERMQLENEKLKTEVVRDKVELLREIGIPEDRIREALTRHVVKPLSELDPVQDSGLIDGAEVIELPETSSVRRTSG